MTTSILASHPLSDYTIQFCDLALVVAGSDFHVYSAWCEGMQLFWETVAEPTVAEVIDGALSAWKAECGEC